jgi:outer membrane biosynthesis protein TonB
MPVKEQPEPENPQAVDQPDAALDHRVRVAMKTLDDEAGSGYFDAAPNQILNRLETPSMQTTTTGTSDDSGLHDIRSLAQNTKARLSKKITAAPVPDDVPQGSGSFQMIALPEPAKMVSLPELAALPSKAEIKALDKAAKAAKKAEVATPVTATSTSTSTATPVAAKVAPAPFAPKPAANNNTRVIAIIGACVVAAAGVGLFVMTQGSSAKSAAPDTTLASREAAKPTPPPAAPVVAAAVAPTPPPAPEPVPEVVPPPPPPVETPAPAPVAHKAAPAHAAAPAAPKAPKEDVKPAAAPGPMTADKAATTPKPGDPSFDDLLKEAGVQDGQHKQAAPKLAKKSLSFDDIKNGMSPLSGKAQACFKGTQGTAMVKLIVAPSGQVTKVSVGGAFAGKPEADCVAGIARSATFPPWDGGPQTVNYSYLLSE